LTAALPFAALRFRSDDNARPRSLRGRAAAEREASSLAMHTQLCECRAMKMS
jgi:hypothetical protein